MVCVRSEGSTNVRKHLLTIIFQLVRLFSRHKVDHLLFKAPRFWGIMPCLEQILLLEILARPDGVQYGSSTNCIIVLLSIRVRCMSPREVKA